MIRPSGTAVETGIAIIGMAGRFPGASDVDAFWENVAAGVRSVRTFSDEELIQAGVDAALLRHPRYVKAGTIIEGFDRFDGNFFGYPPSEAQLIDPQHRLFLECAWEALEDAAYAPEAYRGLIAVYAGAAPSTYVSNTPRGDTLESTAPYLVAMHNSADSLASRVSYKLNLRGPSVAVQTFCSTSLVAAHMACQSLLTYECALALAGGVTISIPQGVGYVYHEGGILSPDGCCRPFDARGQGSVMGNGVAVVVLKRLGDALADGDHVYAVIRGSAVNNDGVRKVGYTAPGLAGQVAVINTALRRAGVDPATVTYIEAHGTATALGDSVELDAMKQAFAAAPKKRFCALGSVKANIGHLDRAAGITGLIKTALALDRKQLPPSVDVEGSRPSVDLENSTFYVNTTRRQWETDGEPRRAGVSSFGVGGTNAHMVLEEAPPLPIVPASRSHQLLVLSAKTAHALDAMTRKLAVHLRRHPELDLADVSWTLMVGRTSFNHRRALVCRDVKEAVALLESPDAAGVMTGPEVHRKREIVFRFSDTSAASVALESSYGAEPAFRDAVDACRAIGGVDPLRCEQFAFRYGLAKLLTQWGLEPRALTGTGVGNDVAAALSGAVTLRQALLRHGSHSADGVVSNQPHDDRIVVEIAPIDLGSLLDVVGRLWIAGVPFDWASFHREKRRRVRLPSYPFERQRYWLPTIASGRAEIGDLEGERKADIADWFYLPSWKRSATPPPRAQESAIRWLILADEDGVGARVAEWLVGRGHLVATVSWSAVRPGGRADFERVLRDFAGRGGLPNQIVHLWMVGGDRDSATGDDHLNQTTERGFHSLIALTQALGDCGADDCQITLISTGLHDVEVGDRLNPAKATALGPIKVIPQECPGIRCRSIDIAMPPDEASARLLTERLGAELLGESIAGVVALRGPYRWVQSFESVRLPPGRSSSRLRRDGIYLITGGLGGIGLGMAEHLADTVGARLALVGRSALPPRDQWPQLLVAHGPEHPVGRRVRVVQALEAKGVELLVLQADVSSDAQMRRAVDQTVSRFGGLHGVLHTAGIPGAGLIALKSPTAAAQVLAPKVQGTVALARALEGIELDFLVLFSSVTSVVGGPGQVDYAAANTFLETFARAHRNDHGFTAAISWGEWLWDAWQNGLQGFPVDIQRRLIASRQKYGISFSEGAEVLCRVLSGDLPHVYVATFDLHDVVRASSDGLVTRILDGVRERSGATVHYPRPALASSLIVPRNDGERQIADVWSDVLGIAPIGIDDNFFELGGNSLLGLEVAACLRKTLDVDVAVQRLYEAPTVRTLAERLQKSSSEELDRLAADWKNRSEKRRERFRHAAARS
jgi:acyl transferase domain-containing protein